MDWGAGAGHLSHALAFRHGLRAVAVEATAPLCAAGSKRSAEFQALQAPLLLVQAPLLLVRAEEAEAGCRSGASGAGNGSSNGSGDGNGAAQGQRGDGWGGWRGYRQGAPEGRPQMAAVAHKLPWGGDCCGEVGSILSKSRLLHPEVDCSSTTASAEADARGGNRDCSSGSGQQHNGRRALFAGLHACGDLTAGITRTMLSDRGASALVSVACCYNLLTEPEDPERAATDTGRARPPFDGPLSGRSGERSAAESVLRAMLPEQNATASGDSPTAAGGADSAPPQDAGASSGSGAEAAEGGHGHGHEHGFPLSEVVSVHLPHGIGRSARMLACQSADRWAAEGGGVTEASLRWLPRALRT